MDPVRPFQAPFRYPVDWPLLRVTDGQDAAFALNHHVAQIIGCGRHKIDPLIALAFPYPDGPAPTRVLPYPRPASSTQAAQSPSGRTWFGRAHADQS